MKIPTFQPFQQCHFLQYPENTLNIDTLNNIRINDYWLQICTNFQCYQFCLYISYDNLKLNKLQQNCGNYWSFSPEDKFHSHMITMIT